MFLHSIKIDDKIELRGVATDGHILALTITTNTDLTTEIEGIIIPKKTINEIRKIIDNEENIHIGFSRAKIKIVAGKSTIISKLIDGQYPEYDRVIPKNNDQKVVINKKELFGAVDRVATVSNDKNKSVKLTIEENKISFQVKTNDNSFADEEISANYSGEKIETGFNPRYFLEVIGQISDEELEINFKEGFSPAIVKSKNHQGLYVIMPVRV